MSGPMRSFLVLNGAVLVFLAIVWWADGQIPFDRIKASADHAASLDKLHASLASSTTFVEAHDVASRSTVLAERLNRRLVSLADLLLRTRELIGIQWWLMVWVLFSNAILVSGLQEGRSASLENEPQAEREFQLRLVPITIFGWVCFMLFGLVTGEEVAVSNWTWPVFGFIWTSVVMAIITRYMKIAVSPVGFRCWKLGGSQCWVRWQDIEAVRPFWLPLGCSSLRVYFKGSAGPVWLPVSLSEFEAFRLYAFQFLEDQNPLKEHLAKMK